MDVQSTLVDIIVNGETRQIPSDQSVAAMLCWLQIPCDRVAVEVNKQLVRKRDWGQTVVPQASQVEVVEFVGGG